MPTPLYVLIPRSESRDLETDSSETRPRIPLYQQPLKTKPRTYSTEPLPIQPSTEAPRDARIINRVNDYGVVTFELAIGDTKLKGIGLDEVLEYVSAADLETYEHNAFKEEAELLRITHEADEQGQLRHLQRNRERQKRKGIEQWVSVDEDEDDHSLDGEGTGGRARPSYKKNFEVVRMRRRRRKRDPATGELMSLSDGDDGLVRGERSSPSESEEAGGSPKELRRKRIARQRGEAVGNGELELVRRRRRKRDPFTGELLPLSDREGQVEGAGESSSAESEEAETQQDETRQRTESGQRSAHSSHVVLGRTGKPKRPRRRRHPITLELMPIGWKYDPNAEAKQSGKGAVMPSFHRLTLSQEYEQGSDAKRRRLGDSTSSFGYSLRTSVRTSSSRDQSSSVDGETPQVDIKRATTLSAFKNHVTINSITDDEDDDALEKATTRQHASASKPKPSILRRSTGGVAVATPLSSSRQALHSDVSSISEQPQPASAISKRVVPTFQTASSSSSATSSRALAQQSPLNLSQSQPATSIMHPTAPALHRSSSPSSSSEEDGNQYVIEAILKHSLSDPRTHASELGKKPVMLYLVKWEGWEKPSWEPVTSFVDRSLVNAYRRKAGLPAE